MLARALAFLLTIDRRHVVEILGPCINATNVEGAALRAVMLTHGSITPEVTQVFPHPSLEFWPGSQLESLAESPWTGLFSPNNRLHSVLLAWILRLFPFFGVSCPMC